MTVAGKTPIDSDAREEGPSYRPGYGHPADWSGAAPYRLALRVLLDSPGFWGCLVVLMALLGAHWLSGLVATSVSVLLVTLGTYEQVHHEAAPTLPAIVWKYRRRLLPCLTLSGLHALTMTMVFLPLGVGAGCLAAHLHRTGIAGLTPGLVLGAGLGLLLGMSLLLSLSLLVAFAHEEILFADSSLLGSLPGSFRLWWPTRRSFLAFFSVYSLIQIGAQAAFGVLQGLTHALPRSSLPAEVQALQGPLSLVLGLGASLVTCFMIAAWTLRYLHQKHQG